MTDEIENSQPLPLRKKYHFDKERAIRAINFISFLTHTKGRWANKKFRILDWQKELIEKTFGWVDDNGYRQYQIVYVEITKKQGKSELAAAIALYLLVADGEQGAEVYSGAVDRDQASLVFNVAATMVRNSRVLRKRLKIIDSQKRIVDYKTNSVYRVLSSDVESKHGLNVSGLVLDELHAVKKREFIDTLTEGSGDARTQPLIFIITTAGVADKRYICWEYHEYALKVRDGIIPDDRFLPFVIGLQEGEDWEDEENWKKVSPSLGVTFGIDKLREEYEKAKAVPAKQNNFRRLRLNQWVQQETRWMDMSVWDACSEPADLSKGRRCYLALDLSSSVDLSALAQVIEPKCYTCRYRGGCPNPEDLYDIYCHFFLPKDNIDRRVKQDRVPYDIWAWKGYITLSPGNVIDYAFIEKKIEELHEMNEVVDIGYDRWGATQISTSLTGKGFNMIPIGQGFASMSSPTKELETLVLKRKIRHGGHPVLRWNMNNMVIRQDPAGNIKPDKEHSSDKIDGIVAVIMALDRTIRHEKSMSVYETRGMVNA